MQSLRSDIQELAMFGGQPAFQEKLHVGRPNIGNRERLFERINEMLDRRWLSNAGPFVQEFEKRIAERIGVKYCIATCNATIALEIAIKAMGLAGEVIIPSFTFVATAHALQWQGITPVFCDIDPCTHNLDPYRVEQAITPRTSGIIGVHVWGRPCRVEELASIAQRHGLKLLFDAAHAFDCSYKGCMLGNFGDAEVFSFHATKFFNTFEGGAIVTNDNNLAKKLTAMKSFGFTWYDQVDSIGTNGKMTEISAAMGLTSLESLDEFVAVNRRNYDLYQTGLDSIPGVSLVRYDDKDKCNYQYIVMEMDSTITGVSRDILAQILQAENVIARRYFYPGCHRMEPYRSLYPDVGEQLPATEDLSKRVLLLPTGTAVNSGEIVAVCQIIRLAIAHGPDIQSRLMDK